MGYPKKHRGRRKQGSKKRRAKRKKDYLWVSFYNESNKTGCQFSQGNLS